MTVPADAIIEYWPEDLSAGQLPNRAGSGPAEVFGGPALLEGGNFQYLAMRVTDAIRFSVPACTDFTLAYWTRYATPFTNTYHHVFTFDSDQLVWLMKKLNGSGSTSLPPYSYYHYPGAATASVSTKLRPPSGSNAWFLLTIKRSEGIISTHINGIAGETFGSIDLPAGTYSIGAPSTKNINTEVHDFDLGPVRFFNRALSLNEIFGMTAEFAQPVDGGPSDLVAHIAGTVAIDVNAARREVIVISDDPNGCQVLGQGMSAPDGTFDIEYADWGGAVIALALDNYGGDWSPETVLGVGTIIHPTTPNGYVYEVTDSGTTGTTEPTWSINGALNDGSVTYNPKPFYRPIASGPLQGEVLPEPV